MDQRPNNYNDQGPNGQGPNGNGGPGGPKNKSSLLVLLICVLATLLIWTVFSNILQSSTSKEITYDKFLEMLDKGEVKSVELQSGVLTIVPREQKVEGVEFEYSTTAMEDSTTLTARLLETEQKTGNKITFNEIQPDPTGSIIYTILSLLVPFVFLIILMNWLMRKRSTDLYRIRHMKPLWKKIKNGWKITVCIWRSKTAWAELPGASGRHR